MQSGRSFLCSLLRKTFFMRFPHKKNIQHHSCINCLLSKTESIKINATKHNAFSFQCPLYINERNRIISRTEFGIKPSFWHELKDIKCRYPKVLYTNIRSINKNIHNLESHTNNFSDIDVVAVSEAWLNPYSKLPYLSGFNYVFLLLAMENLGCGSLLQKYINRLWVRSSRFRWGWFFCRIHCF